MQKCHFRTFDPVKLSQRWVAPNVDDTPKQVPLRNYGGHSAAVRWGSSAPTRDKLSLFVRALYKGGSGIILIVLDPFRVILRLRFLI